MYRGCDIPKPVIGDWASKERAPFVLNLSRVNMNYDLVPPEVIREARAAYLGLITQNDYNMGRLFEALQDAGLFDEAMLVYTSDHGELLGDHRTGGKSFFFEGSAHIPMAVRLPKSWERRMPGSAVKTPVCLADVLPTIVRAAGGESAGADGLDMTALARGDIQRPRRFVECTSNCGGSPAFWGLTDGRWKYTWFFEGPGETLFDLSSDPYEKVDLSRSKVHAPKVEEMRAEAAKLLAARGSSLVEGGRLITRSVRSTDEATLRSTSWPGFHSERCDLDVRH
jgi:arylsulfatase A-like enzyme